MNTRLRTALLFTAASAAAIVAVICALRLILPGAIGALGDLPSGLIAGIGGILGIDALGVATAEMVIGFAGALGVLAAIVLLRFGESGRDSGRPRIHRMLRVIALASAALVALATPGGIIAAAGYTFAMLVLAGIVVLTVLLALRRPWAGLIVAIAIAGVVVWAVLRNDGAVLLGRILISFGPIAPTMLTALAHLITAAALVAWMLVAGSGGDSGQRDAVHRGAFARFVLRHRVAITVAAALCAAPYVIARASWLTPWPLFSPGADALAAAPMVQLTGLMLGLGMLTGAILTLGLVLPWGERFPRWMAGVGGRRVPPLLAVLPATLVAVLFTFGGLELVVASASWPTDAVVMALVLPFWLWGPLLGLATWAYAMRARSRTVPRLVAR